MGRRERSPVHHFYFGQEFVRILSVSQLGPALNPLAAEEGCREMSIVENYVERPRESRSDKVELAVLAYEVRVLIEVVMMGLESLMEAPQAILVKEELAVLAKLAGQGSDALVALDAALDEAPIRLRA